MKLGLSFFSILFFTITGSGQVSKVSLQASGLTCSMCSNSIYKSLKTISFVDRIESNIKTSTFEITFKKDSRINFNEIKDKVEDAGFGVAKFIAIMDCDNVAVKINEAVKIGNLKFQFLNMNSLLLNGQKHFKIMNKGFVPVKEYKKSIPAVTVEPGVYIALIQG